MCQFWLELFLFNPGLHVQVGLLPLLDEQPVLIDLNPEGTGKNRMEMIKMIGLVRTNMEKDQMGNKK